MSLRKDARFLIFGAWLILCGVFCGKVLASTEKDQTVQSIAHYMMGLFYDWGEDPLSASKEYQKALANDADSFNIRMRLGLDYARTGKLKEAVEELKNALKLNPQDLQCHYFLALVYTAMKNSVAANQEYEIILKSFSKEEPQNTQVLLYLGQLYFQQRRFDEAIAQFQQVLKYDPQNIDAIFLLSALYEKKGEIDAAIRYLKQLIAIDPKNAAALNSLGYIYTQQGKNLDEAEGLIRRALAIESDNGAYIDSLGWIHFKKAVINNDLQLLQTAIKELERANSLMPDPEILDHLGEAYLKNGEILKAKGLWRKSLEMNPEQKALKEKLLRLESVK